VVSVPRDGTVMPSIVAPVYLMVSVQRDGTVRPSIIGPVYMVVLYKHVFFIVITTARNGD
jgi:hypothetical protein